MKKYFMYGLLGVVLLWPGGAYGVGLAVGVFGGYAVPTGDMATDDGFDLGASPAFTVRTLIGLSNYLALEAGGGYQVKYPPQKKEHGFAEFTEAFPVNAGVELGFNVRSFRFSGTAGGGYYIINTKLVGDVDFEDVGFGNRPYATYVSINAPGIYVGGGVSYLLQRFTFAFTPRFNYVFNSGTYEGTIESGGEPVRKTSETKDWNDSYFELMAGVVYTLF
jgi:hypothetical protein